MFTLTLDGYYDIQPNGSDTTYMRALTSRHVNGELRLLTLTHTGILQEFALGSTPLGGKVSSPLTAQWNIGAVTGDHTGIWYEEAKSRLWVTATVDYGDSATYYPTRISTLTLGANGAVTNVKTVSLQGVTSKRVYGGVRAVPTAYQAQLGGAYLVGWGGYTSLVAATSRAAIGPSVIAIPDIASYANGAVIPASAFKVLLDTDTGNRGLRVTLPQNYFDGAPEWLTYPPTAPPDKRSSWLSPNTDAAKGPLGVGWFVWGDSYYNNGEIIGDSFVAIAALGKGKCWYQNSTLNFDGRTQEAHVWSLASLANGPLTRPTSMTELVLPKGNEWGSGQAGNTPGGNISGVTFDATTNKLYAVIYPGGADINTGRLYRFSLSATAPTPVPTPTPDPVPVPPATGGSLILPAGTQILLPTGSSIPTGTKQSGVVVTVV